MKPMLFIITTLLYCSLLAQSSFYKSVDDFLKSNVDENGDVDYPGIKNSPQTLNQLVKEIAYADFWEMSEREKKAFLINSYNVLVISQVVDLWPIKSPLDKPSFFTGIKHNVAGKLLTLDKLEKEALMKEFFDPRAHFVLVCAAKSCPPLARYAYFPASIENQLEARTKYILNFDRFISINKTVGLSKIFEWYAKDFGKGKREILAYVNQYRNEKIDLSKKVKYYSYDWSLNKK